MTEPPRDRIWDLHCHLSGVPGRTPDELMAGLIARADRMGIERLIVFMGYPTVVDPSPAELRRQNDQVLQALSHWHHRALGFAYVSPNHVEASLREIDRCVRDGPMVGIKLWVAHRCDDAAIDPIIARAHELKAAIYQHTWIKVGGNDPGESLPARPRRAGGPPPGHAAHLRPHRRQLGARHPHGASDSPHLDRPGRLGPHRRLRRDGRPRAGAAPHHLRQRRGGPWFCLATGQGPFGRDLRGGQESDPRREPEGDARPDPPRQGGRV